MINQEVSYDVQVKPVARMLNYNNNNWQFIGVNHREDGVIITTYKHRHSDDLKLFAVYDPYTSLIYKVTGTSECIEDFIHNA